MICAAALLGVLTALLPPSDEALVKARTALIEAAFPEGRPAGVDPAGKGSASAFLTVLASSRFLHEEVGPFDVYVHLADGYREEREARKVLTKAANGLKAVVPVMERYFSGEPGLIAGRRHPIVLAHADVKNKQTSFDEIIALLEWAEDDASGWKQNGGVLWTDALRKDITVRTWDVQLFNLAHETALNAGSSFLDHGLGYFTLAHIVARLLNQGAWGMVPPWLAQGLTDELDITAYEKAWVGGDWWTSQTPGWFRPGWSGFLPTGHRPPPVVTGPPADLAVTVSRGGDSWQHRDHSTVRHWDQLVSDRKSAAPASFRFMAESESFLPRDRALARCLLHLLLDVAPPAGHPGLIERLDRVPSTPPSGMPDSDPLPVVLGKVLGGVAGVDELEALPLGEMLDRIGHSELKERFVALGVEPLLAIADHREQAQWLYKQDLSTLGWDARREVFQLILTAEFHQQLAAWIPLGDALDQAAARAFEAARRYPSKPRDREKVVTAFWQDAEG